MADGARGQVQELVSVAIDACVEIGNTNMRPVTTNQRSGMAHHIGLGDRAVDVCVYERCGVVWF